jgi:hypothetical protein
MAPEEYERNQAAHRRLKEPIAREYPRGWFVAIADEKVIGAAETVLALEKLLREQGIDPRSVLAVEAGVEYPNHVTIFHWSGVPKDLP